MKEPKNSCAKTIISWAIIGVVIPTLLLGWLDFTDFPYGNGLAGNLPETIVTWTLGLLSLPTLAVIVFTNISDGWLGTVADLIGQTAIALVAIAVNTGVYALIGAYACKLKQSLRTNHARFKEDQQQQ